MNPPKREWSLFLLGRAELLDSEGRLVRLPTRKVLLLLAVLGLHQDEFLDRSRLAETVWPSAAPLSARDSLRNALACLRKALPEGAIDTVEDRVRLRAGFLACDAAAPQAAHECASEFMPGFDDDWAVDLRLRMREKTVAALLDSAEERWSRGERSEALELAERACAADPHSEAAIGLRVQYLEELGRVSQAVAVSDAYRVKAIRDLGVVSEVRPHAPVQGDHPLIIAAEWMLDRDPGNTAGLLASTHSQWLTMPVEAAADLHRRALEVCTESSSARSVVHAQLMNLLVLSGKLAPHIQEAEDSLDRALEAGENLVAARLAGALAYGHLSAGDFRRSLYFAQKSLACAKGTRDLALEAEFGVLLGIIQQQVGMADVARATFREYEGRVLDHGTPQEIAGFGFFTSIEWIHAGKVDRASGVIEGSRRIFESCGSLRMISWVVHMEATIHEAVGDHHSARECYREIQRIGPEVGGHSITAMTDDWLACVECNLGEFDTAAEALARASLYRRKLGTVASTYERAHVRPTRRLIKERLDDRDLKAAYSRAAGGLTGLGNRAS